jgi:putative endonuclease
VYSKPGCHPGLDPGSRKFHTGITFVLILVNIQKRYMPYYVYTMANKRNGTIYTGITNNIVRRVYEHKFEVYESFTQKYHLHRLVHCEIFDDIQLAILREKRIKKWPRKWKLVLIEKVNPDWNDLSEDWFG